MENEADAREGAMAALPLFESGEVQGMLIVARERGNCSAYNAGWQTALLHFPAFGTCSSSTTTNSPTRNGWSACAQPARRSAPTLSAGRKCRCLKIIACQMGRTSGVRAALPADRTGRGALFVGKPPAWPQRARRDGAAFPRPRFNFMGGGDSDFLSRSRAGFRLAWCAEAKTLEMVPARRVEADWIRARILRNGVISTLVEKKKRAAEAARPAAVFAKEPGAAGGFSVPRGRSGWPDRVGFNRALSQSMSRSAACLRNSDMPMSNIASLRRTEPARRSSPPSRRGVSPPPWRRRCSPSS